MLCTYRTLVCPQQPSFQQCSYPVDAWHHDVGWLWAGRQNRLLANIAPLGEIIVSFPAIGVYNRAWLNGPPHKRDKAFRADIGNASKPDSAKPLWHRTSGWLCATSHETKGEGASLSPEKSCRTSAKSGADMLHTEAHPC